MNKNPRTVRYKQTVFIIVIFICIAVNLFYLIPHLKVSLNKRARGPYQFYAHYFTEVKDRLKKNQFIGYCTDKNLNEPYHNAIFTQAQYELAPIILVPNSLNHNYIFFAYNSDEKALAIINKIRATPHVKNSLNIILAEKKPWYY